MCAASFGWCHLVNAYGVKSGWSCGWQVKLCDPVDTCHSVALRDCLGRKNALYKYLILYFLLYRLPMFSGDVDRAIFTVLQPKYFSTTSMSLSPARVLYCPTFSLLRSQTKLARWDMALSRWDMALSLTWSVFARISVLLFDLIRQTEHEPIKLKQTK